MAAGNTTFIGDILIRIGLYNVLKTEVFKTINEIGRYPKLSLEDIKSLKPELILLSSEPYPFKVKHIKQLQEILPHAKISLVDGELFSWYGSRLQKSVEYFNNIF